MIIYYICTYYPVSSTKNTFSRFTKASTSARSFCKQWRFSPYRRVDNVPINPPSQPLLRTGRNTKGSWISFPDVMVLPHADRRGIFMSDGVSATCRLALHGFPVRVVRRRGSILTPPRRNDYSKNATSLHGPGDGSATRVRSKNIVNNSTINRRANVYLAGPLFLKSTAFSSVWFSAIP